MIRAELAGCSQRRKFPVLVNALVLHLRRKEHRSARVALRSSEDIWKISMQKAPSYKHILIPVLRTTEISSQSTKRTSIVDPKTRSRTIVICYKSLLLFLLPIKP